MIELLATHMVRGDVIRVAIGGLIMRVKVASIGPDSVVLQPIEGGEPWRCHPSAVVYNGIAQPTQ